MTPDIAPPPRFARLALAGPLALAIACGDTASLKPVGGGWYTHYTSAYNPDGHGYESLYRKASTGTIRVEQAVRGILRFYPPDCVVYDTQRDVGVIYAACGDHTPFAVASYAVWKGDSYRLDADGLAFPEDPRVSNGHAVATVSRIPIDSIRAYAEAQPIIHEGWAPAPDGHRMQPVITEEPVGPDGRGGAQTTALFEAVRRQQPDVVDALLRDGAAVDAPSHSRYHATSSRCRLRFGYDHRSTADRRGREPRSDGQYRDDSAPRGCPHQSERRRSHSPREGRRSMQEGRPGSNHSRAGWT